VAEDIRSHTIKHFSCGAVRDSDDELLRELMHD
jgi:hypothetical protein